MTVADGVALGFRSCSEEVTGRRLPVSGSLPDWLDGTLVRNGPGRFEVGGDRVEHWFDGLAMLQKFAFDGTGVRYTNRFLRSDAYDRATRTGDLPGQFASGGGYLRRLRRLLAGADTDNCNVHVARLDGDLVALTEVPVYVSVDIETLETRGRFAFDDDLHGHLSTAHLIPDPHRGETVGLLTEFGRTSAYRLFALPDGSRRRREITRIETSKPAYVHSIALAADHVVVTEHPFRIDLLSVLTPGGAGFVDHVDWEPDRGTTFHVVHRETGRVVATHDAPATFVFHHVNAYEAPVDDQGTDSRSVVVDLVDYPDASVIDGLRLEGLADWLTGGIDGRLRRFRLPLDRDATVSGTILAEGLELPRIAPAARTQPYRYVYAQGSASAEGNDVLKVDVDSGRTTTWGESGLFVEEPVPVRAPDAPADGDAGVVLVTALDVAAGHSVLLVLDAETLTERARAPLPHHLPFGFHGRYFSEPGQTG